MNKIIQEFRNKFVSEKTENRIATWWDGKRIATPEMIEEFILKALNQQKKEIEKVIEVGLKEIIKKEGAYSHDQLKHAENTIENMVRIAHKILKTIKEL